MSTKIKVENPLVVLHGDEMAQVAFTEILARFVTLPLDIQLVEIDLSATKRFSSNGAVIHEAISALKAHGVGIKNAGMTVNRAQLDDLLSQHPNVVESTLDPLATKSPNGAIRKGISGNITREDIEFRNIQSVRPNWIDRDIEVDTMETGGLDFSYSELSNATGVAKVMFVGSSGEPVELHRRSLNKGDPWMLATNCLEEVKAWAHRFFQRAIEEKRDIYLGLKDTVVSGYDGVMRTAIEEIYTQEYQARVAEAGLSYQYELIDAQAARIVSNPPKRALWGVPDNVSGMKLFKLVQQLKRYGLPERKAHVSISRMSAGGGDQYGSYNTPSPEGGVIKVIVDGEEKHARYVKEGDPILFMSNDRDAIKDWVSQVFKDAAVNKKEVYFGLKREFVNYDEVYSSIILEIRKELAALDTPPPSFMIMRPSRQLSKMICDPPRWGMYPAQNLDGDIFSDISAALGGSLATASSVIISKDGTKLFEAPHGTAHDLYVRYLETEGKEANFNSSALIFAVANALEELAGRENNSALTEYAARLKSALIETVAQGVITGDLKGKTTAPDAERIVDMNGFLDAVASNLSA
ncbi:isocitrate/isopropylmalate family dehydrogenase [Luminiphilus sp.]|nr:isocitrate/isopropylmalate family dehydrogenase [Luminiphilus sp.]MDB2312099.1 isocitrate/isopropylmalate family dehydrogenase [Luminiphilus sp.]MDB2377713.1 isocitrate/isopropylmalate family dehydrogenase [Luminiphilus sp.]MDB2440554.1 isocitrate/isopropylmalate family dehydrogenase [Luminiphilus sp.]MDB2511753.1 isocitrate/isopropylmalate family dehydrogenase [Luminiphilus sp.]